MIASEIASYLTAQQCVVAGSSEGTIRTSHEIGTYSIEIVGILGSGFPHALPDYYLCNRGTFGRLAHVGWPKMLILESNETLEDIGLICSGSSDALALDFHTPEKVYLAGLTKAIATFDRALVDSECNDEECLLEFAGHWQFAVEQMPIVLFGESPDRLAEIVCSREKPGAESRYSKPIALVKGIDSHSKNYWPRKQGESEERIKSGKGLLIELSNLPTPPAPGECLVQWWMNCLQAQPANERKLLRDKARHFRSKELWILCHARYQDQDVWFALIATSSQKERAPLAVDLLQGWAFSARKVEPHTRNYLIPRGGGSAALQEKSILLVGCGSVGSIVANSLASSGVGKLALSDHDRFCLDNLYRHSLDMLWDGSLKSHAIAASLRSKYPFTVFECFETKLLEFSEDDLKSYDLVIVAIGNSTHEFAFNERMIGNGIETPVIYTWLEPNGIGGHAVLAGGDYQDGCHQCNFLIPGGDGERMLTPNLNFLKEDQSVTKHLGSCGSLFLPYSEIDSSQTANLAARLAVRFLLGKTMLGRKSSWRGDLDPEDFSELQFSDRFYQFESQLKELPIKNRLCKLCSE